VWIVSQTIQTLSFQLVLSVDVVGILSMGSRLTVWRLLI
jgi:hypothetical protein